MDDSRWKGYWASTAGSILIAVQFVLWPILGFGRMSALMLAGTVTLCAGVALFSLSIIQLQRLGGLARGDASMETTKLVATGVYSIVRHPQYVAWLMFSVATILIVQHWIVGILGAASIGLFCLDLRKADADEGVDRFGEAYLEYMQRVPGWNPVAGLWRRLRSRRS